MENLFGEEVIARYGRNKSKRLKRRGEVYRAFMAKMNPSRVAAGFLPLTEPRLGYMLKGIPDDDLEVFYMNCEKARNFGAYFNWAIKNQAPVKEPGS